MDIDILVHPSRSSLPLSAAILSRPLAASACRAVRTSSAAETLSAFPSFASVTFSSLADLLLEPITRRSQFFLAELAVAVRVDLVEVANQPVDAAGPATRSWCPTVWTSLRLHELTQLVLVQFAVAVWVALRMLGEDLLAGELDQLGSGGPHLIPIQRAVHIGIQLGIPFEKLALERADPPLDVLSHLFPINLPVAVEVRLGMLLQNRLRIPRSDQDVEKQALMSASPSIPLPIKPICPTAEASPARLGPFANSEAAFEWPRSGLLGPSASPYA
jgi:hypothetical protein